MKNIFDVLAFIQDVEKYETTYEIKKERKDAIKLVVCDFLGAYNCNDLNLITFRKHYNDIKEKYNLVDI